MAGPPAPTTYNWTCPAGVTEITISPTGGYPSTPRNVTVVPGTTYLVTIINGVFNLNNPNTFGSLFSWTNAPDIKITWLE